MQKPVLPQSQIDKCGLYAAHYLGYFAKVNIPHHFLFVGSFNKELCQAPFFGDSNARLVGGSVDYNLFLHTELWKMN